MYFRINVTLAAGHFVFRTSKIEDSKQMLALLSRIRAGFPVAEGFTISVLRAAPSTGEFLSDEQVAALEAPSVSINDPALAEHPVAQTNAASWNPGCAD